MHYRTSRATDFLTSTSLIYSKKSMGGFLKGKLLFRSHRKDTVFNYIGLYEDGGDVRQ